jgi:hypothetical protein
MRTIISCAAIAGAVMFGAGSAAWAQGYMANPGTPGAYSSNPSTQGDTGTATYMPSQQSWDSGMPSTNTPSGKQGYSQTGYGMGNNITTYQEAEHELGRYGYSNVHDLRAMQGWSADAMRNGQRVHIIIGENGQIATFPGR